MKYIYLVAALIFVPHTLLPYTWKVENYLPYEVKVKIPLMSCAQSSIGGTVKASKETGDAIIPGKAHFKPKKVKVLGVMLDPNAGCMASNPNKIEICVNQDCSILDKTYKKGAKLTINQINAPRNDSYLLGGTVKIRSDKKTKEVSITVSKH